ncbi:phasin family protein [Frateuria hangzhouensis]|uniref:phasin family protein n=1 Tax=Frateuria hangzhouensis TaxID=2995589 RepID=UPI002260BBA5|nr:phasin family protein [Frateuria sp. STR12]MCX7513216.1 phasin family protein [Frateuria sp. STR12]
MTHPFDSQVFDYARQFADNAFRAQALMLKGIEQAAGLQLGALEQQSRSTAGFFAAAGQARDAEALRGLWDKGVALGREQAEQAVVLSQGLVAVGRQTAESLGALAQPRQAANDAAVAPGGRKAAAK